MILAPMIWPDVLPQASAITHIFTPVAPPPPPLPPGHTAVRPQGARVGSRPQLPWEPPRQPSIIPTSISMDEAPAVAFRPPGSVVGFAGDGAAYGGGPGVPGGTGLPTGALPPPPPAVEKPKDPEPTKRITSTSQLDQAQLIRRVDPVYPEMAVRMRVSGVVELRGIVGTDGRIRELKVLRGHPLLVKAALEAVSQWVYRPTRLSGVP